MAQSEMCKAIEDMKTEAAAQAEWGKAVIIAMQLLTMGVLTGEQIAQATGLKSEEVQELKQGIQKPVPSQKLTQVSTQKR
jgi:hypothetical protein